VLINKAVVPPIFYLLGEIRGTMLVCRKTRYLGTAHLDVGAIKMGQNTLTTAHFHDVPVLFYTRKFYVNCNPLESSLWKAVY